MASQTREPTVSNKISEIIKVHTEFATAIMTGYQAVIRNGKSLEVPKLNQQRKPTGETRKITLQQIRQYESLFKNSWMAYIVWKIQGLARRKTRKNKPVRALMRLKPAAVTDLKNIISNIPGAVEAFEKISSEVVSVDTVTAILWAAYYVIPGLKYTPKNRVLSVDAQGKEEKIVGGVFNLDALAPYAGDITALAIAANEGSGAITALDDEEKNFLLTQGVQKWAASLGDRVDVARMPKDEVEKMKAEIGAANADLTAALAEVVLPLKEQAKEESKSMKRSSPRGSTKGKRAKSPRSTLVFGE